MKSGDFVPKRHKLYVKTRRVAAPNPLSTQAYRNMLACSDTGTDSRSEGPQSSNNKRRFK